MIELKRLSPVVLASATTVTVALGATVIILTSYLCHNYKQFCHRHKHSIEQQAPADDRYVLGELRQLLVTVAGNGSPACEEEARRLALFADRGAITPKSAESLIACYETAGDSPAAAIVSQVMTQRFPDNPTFFNYLGSYQLQFDNLDGALESLNRGLELEERVGMEREDAAMLHNNFAWAMLQLNHSHLEVVQRHSRRAMELDDYGKCSILHTRLTYEFGKLMELDKKERNINVWRNLRQVYANCLDSMQGPQSVDDDGMFKSDSISMQVLSTDVMDRMIFGSTGMSMEEANYLEPAQRAIYEVGVDKFCKHAMAIRSKNIQAACVDTIKQASTFWQ